MRVLLISVSAWAAAPAFGAQEPSYAPAPSWVVAAPASPQGGSAGDGAIVLLDSQTRLGPDNSEHYVEIASRYLAARSPRGEPIVLPFSPDRQDLIIHKVRVARGGQVIDLLDKGQRFITIRRETNLEAATLDGVLTAVMQPEGLQDGDLLSVAFTIIDRGGVVRARPENLVTAAYGASPGLYRVRTVWPKVLDVKVRGAGLFKDAKVRSIGDMRELSYSLTAPKLAMPPKDAPARVIFDNLIQASSYSGWNEVGALLAPHFEKASTLASDAPLHKEVAAIMAATPDPAERAMKALRLVQDQVRYVLLAMDGGDYVPASAEQTWSRRFGDCKGKTALLLALLRAMDIPATPVLVRSAGGEALDTLLPSLRLFDHVVVKAEIAGSTYWLDGTRIGDRDIDELKSFAFGVGLPIQAQGATPTAFPYAPPSKPIADWTVRIDAREGMTLPAPTTVEYRFRGAAAAYINASLVGAPREETDKYLKDLVSRLVDDLVVDNVRFDFDADQAILKVAGEGKTTLDWNHPTRVVGRRVAFEQDTVKWNISLERSAEQAGIPIVLGSDAYVRGTQEIRLPRDGKGFKVDGETISLDVAGAEIRRSLTIEGDTARQIASFRLARREISAGQAVADKPKITVNNKKLAHLVAPIDYTVTEKEGAAALAAKPETADQFSERGVANMNANRWADARKDFDRAIELDPDNAWHLGNRSITHYWMGRIKEARADAEKSLAIGTNMPAHNTMGMIHILDGDLDAAVASFSRALEVRPDSMFSLEKRAQVRIARRDFAGAAADIDEVAKLTSDPTGPSRLRALMHRVAGDHKAALDALAQIKLTPDTEAGVRLDRAQMLRMLNRVSEADMEIVKARASIEAGLQTVPAEIREQYRGTTLDELGAHDEARAVLDRLVARNDSGQILNARCWSIATFGAEAELPKALKDCDDAIERVVGFSAAYDSRGLVKLKMGRFDEAIADYTTALDDMPNSPGTLFGRGLARLRKGDQGGAKDLLVARALSPAIDERFARYGLRAP